MIQLKTIYVAGYLISGASFGLYKEGAMCGIDNDRCFVAWIFLVRVYVHGGTWSVMVSIRVAEFKGQSSRCGVCRSMPWNASSVIVSRAGLYSHCFFCDFRVNEFFKLSSRKRLIGLRGFRIRKNFHNRSIFVFFSDF